MQYDMHYYGTYAMAASAGIKPEHAQIIATAAQFVDDHNLEQLVTAPSGEGILGIATAHHPLNAGVRVTFTEISADDSRMVWVPFHFLPGNEGESFEQRLVAQKNSAVANKMLDYYLSPETLAAHKDHMLHLIGIAAHVYADTFSHYGFSGISSSLNGIDEDSLDVDDSHSEKIIDYLKQKLEKFKASFGDLVELGHGAVATYPDRPYLKWSFRYRDGVISQRDNPATFLEGCHELHKRFRQFAKQYYDHPVEAIAEWPDMENAVAKILACEAGADDRAAEWLKAMHGGALGKIAAPAEYGHSEWEDEVLAMREGAEIRTLLASNGYRFFIAADYHRNYVLKRLLPEFDLLVA